MWSNDDRLRLMYIRVDCITNMIQQQTGMRGPGGYETIEPRVRQHFWNKERLGK